MVDHPKIGVDKKTYHYYLITNMVGQAKLVVATKELEFQHVVVFNKFSK
jgi:hypothetical protein